MQGIYGSHDWPWRGLERALGRARQGMERVDLGDLVAVERALLDHQPRTAGPFLGGLEEKHRAARVIPCFREVFRRAKQHGGVPVMAAGMGTPRHGAGVIGAGQVVHRERIHVGAQANGAARCPALDHRDDARARDPGLDPVHPEFAELFHNQFRGLMAIEPKLGMRVQVSPPRGHLVGEPADAIDHGHVWTSLLSRVTLAADSKIRGAAMADDTLIHDPDGGLPRLIEIMARLRDPEAGCPWDIEQDFMSIAPYTIEEAYEVADAIEREAWSDLKSELGDLLLQAVFHAQIAKDKGLFDIADVANAISDKMIDRHPHVFGEENRDKSAEQQTRDWEAVKAAERAASGETGTLDGVALGLPALLRAVKLQKRAARVGFDWPETSLVLNKIREEVEELHEAAESSDPDHIEEEFGDLLFVMANLARHMKLCPETALRRANAKFTRRFEWIEARLAEDGRRPEDSDLAEMDALWNAAKREANL